MPTLDWLNRDEALRIAKHVPYRLLTFVSQHESATHPREPQSAPAPQKVPTAQVQADLLDAETNNQASSATLATHDNLLIQGDNLEALKALLPLYRGQVKCIFIDPPYNTGKAFEHYDDNLEHATWLSLIFPRLSLLRELLREDGFICVHIDDAESHYLKILLDEVFARSNYLISMYMTVRYADKTLKSDMDFHKRVEQALIYRKSYVARPIRQTTEHSLEKFCFEIVTKSAGKVIELGGKRTEVHLAGTWDVRKVTPNVNGLKEIWATGTILDGNSSGRFFRDYIADRAAQDGLGTLYKVDGIGDDELPHRYFTGPKRLGATKGKYYQGVPAAKRESESEETAPIENYFDLASAFGNCRTEGGVEFRSGKKPEAYVQMILEHFSEPADLVLDSFLGSGTTAAVAQKMGRRWIGVEMRDQAQTHCIPRLQKVIDGEQGGISKAVGWSGGGSFQFAQLGATIFDATGAISPDVRFRDLAAFIWMQETGTPWPCLRTKPKSAANESPLLGVHQGIAIFLLFNGILGDRRPRGGNVLTRAVLNHLVVDFRHVGPRIVYGESVRVGDDLLNTHTVLFNPIPHTVQAR
jgi:adenine-specific DNA-methyltransferase